MAKKSVKIDEDLLIEILLILKYFDQGLSDIESGCDEPQPMHKEIKDVLSRIENGRK